MELTSQKPMLDSLQLLRGLAALLITAKHALYEVSMVYPDNFVVPVYRDYTLAIDVFFVLSGFIMAYTTAGKNGASDAKDFILRRILRIVPNYWFYTFLLLGVALVIPQVLDTAVFEPEGFIKSLLFLPYMNPASDVQPFLAVGWSLNYEMYFYTVFAVFLLLPARWMLPAMSVYFLGSVYLLPHILPEGVGRDFYTRPIVLEFWAGAVMGWLFLRGVRLPAVMLWPAAILATFVAAWVFVPDLFEALSGMDYPRGIAAVVIVGCLILPKGAEFVRAPRFFTFMGDSSYTIYLSHAFFIGAVTQFAMLIGFDSLIHPWLMFVAVMVACVIGGGIFYIWIEKPMTNHLKDVVKRLAEKKEVGA